MFEESVPLFVLVDVITSLLVEVFASVMTSTVGATVGSTVADAAVVGVGVTLSVVVPPLSRSIYQPIPAAPIAKNKRAKSPPAIAKPLPDFFGGAAAGIGVNVSLPGA